MSNRKSVSCIGNGFVGGALTTCLSERNIDVYVYDKSDKYVSEAKVAKDLGHSEKYFTSIKDMVLMLENHISNFSNIYFVCVPTPMNILNNNSCDTSIVEQVLEELASASITEKIAVIKSTVPPGFCASQNKKFNAQNLYIIHNPEFLTEANALDDMRNQDRIILGGPRPWVSIVKRIFQAAFPKIPIIKTSSTTAEMTKYFINVQLATRVVLSCELEQITRALDEKGLDIDYDKVQEYACYDKRLGGSHMNVPGNDGLPGAKGHCFPKDLQALTYVANNLGVKPIVMEAVWKKNLEIVKPEERDWEKMIGRAVSKNDKK